MPHDLGLLFDAVTLQRPARLQAIVVPARKGPDERQIPPAVALGLPDVGHLVDEVALHVERGSGEIIAVIGGIRMEVEVPARCHGNRAGLKREPFSPPDTDLRGVDGIAKHRADKCTFARRQFAFSA